jgi:mono/diheme cytochrome c family protein
MRHIFIIVFAALLLIGCTKSNMDDQPKDNEYKAGAFRQPPEGVVARGDLEREKSATQKPTVNAALLQRGRERYEIFCTPCHDRTGQGNGLVVQRGMPHPPSYHDEQLRTAPDQHFFDVITGGYGAMYSYADRIAPRDRWAIVAYIRALQLSRHASLDDVPPEQRAKLGAAP